MASRDEFLKTVRDALARSRAGGHGGDGLGPAPSVASPEDILARAQGIRDRLTARRAALLAQLETAAERQGWKLLRVSTRAGIADAVAGVAARLGAKLAVRSNHAALEDTGIDGALAAAGVQVVPMAYDVKDPEGSRQRLRETAARADLGITGVDYLVAETATAALVSRRGMGRLASLLPPVHIAVAEADQVVESMEELLALRQAELQSGGEASWYMNLISGPSRTADIEMTIVVGVHGPGEVYLVLVG
jgi:L-lactate utilization protein LutC